SAACVKERMSAKHQLFSLAPETGLPPMLLDGRRLQQALVNLLTNASQYTQEGGWIALRCSRHPQSGVVIGVTDNGRGMSEDELRRAMAPFTHVESAYAASGEGMALGIAVAKRLIELQGGSFAIASVPGEGTQIEIKFSAASLTGEGAGHESE